MLSIIDSVQYTFERFNQTNKQNYKEILLILEDLVKLVDSKFKQTDLINFGIIPSKIKRHEGQEEFDNQTSELKLEIFNNPDFIREFRQTIQPYQTLIPNDINLFLKANNLQQLNSNGESNELRFVNLKSKIEILENSLKKNSANELKQNLKIETEDSIINKKLMTELQSGFYSTNNLIIEFNKLIDELKIPTSDENDQQTLNLEEIYIFNSKFQEVRFHKLKYNLIFIK